jgi:hypothetical protein
MRHMVLMALTCLQVNAFAQAVAHEHRLELVQGKVVRVNDLATSAPLILQVRKGDSLQWTLQSDTPGEWHLHALHLSGQLQAGLSQSTRFKATATGRFRVEWHGSGAAAGTAKGHHAPPLLTLEVRPQ